MPGNFCFSFVFGYRNVYWCSWNKRKIKITWDKKLTTTYMLIIVEYIKTHNVVLWFAVYSVRVLARRRHHGRFRAKALIVGLWANLRNAMFIRESAADSRFSHGRRQVFVKSAPCAKPSLSFCWCNICNNVLEIRSNLKFGKNSWPSCQLHY